MLLILGIRLSELLRDGVYNQRPGTDRLATRRERHGEVVLETTGKHSHQNRGARVLSSVTPVLT